MIKIWQFIKSLVNLAHKTIMCVLHLKQLFSGRKRKPAGLKNLFASIFA